jgi:hypothetical protein
MKQWNDRPCFVKQCHMRNSEENKCKKYELWGKCNIKSIDLWHDYSNGRHSFSYGTGWSIYVKEIKYSTRCYIFARNKSICVSNIDCDLKTAKIITNILAGKYSR